MHSNLSRIDIFSQENLAIHTSHSDVQGMEFVSRYNIYVTVPLIVKTDMTKILDCVQQVSNKLLHQL